MSRNYNKVILVGQIESEILLRTTTSGTPVTNFTVTTINKWIDNNNEVKDYKTWHHIVCWGMIAEYVANSFSINDKVIIDGSLSYRTYEKDDARLKVAEIKATNISKWEGSLNRVIIVGNVESDATLQKTTSNISVANFLLSTVERWKDKTGTIKSNKKWHKATCWGKIAEVVADSIKKGALVLAEGTLYYRTVVSKNGIKNNHVAEIKITQLTKWANSVIVKKNESKQS